MLGIVVQSDSSERVWAIRSRAAGDALYSLIKSSLLMQFRHDTTGKVKKEKTRFDYGNWNE